MVKLRLKRMGQKFNAFYRIVAADSRAPRDGRFIEEVGYYNPHTKQLFVNGELRDKWLGEGAIPSETVKGLFRKYKVAQIDENGVATLSIKAKAKKVTTPVVEEVKAVEEPKVVEEVVDTKAEDEAAAKAAAEAKAKKLEEEKAAAEAKRLEEAKAADDSAAKAAAEEKAQADAKAAAEAEAAKKLEEEKAAAEAEAAKKVKKPKKPSVPALKIAIFKEMMVEESGLSKAKVGLAINAVVKAVSETVKKDESVALSGLGTFERVFKKARSGINPLTGEALQIAAKNSPKFKAAKDFKEVVANSAKSNK